jgi:hypothetical protein
MNCVCEFDEKTNKVTGLCGAHAEAFRELQKPVKFTSDEILELPYKILTMILPYRDNNWILEQIIKLCHTFLNE